MEHRLGRGYSDTAGAEWRIERWTGPGGLNDWRSIESGNRLTESQLAAADQVQVSLTYDNGETTYRTFRGPIEYNDGEGIEDIIEYWYGEGSL